MCEINQIKLRQDGSIDTGHYMKLGRQYRSLAAHSATTGFFKQLTGYLATVFAAKSGIDRLTHFDSTAIGRFVAANDADEQVVNAHKFRGVI